MGSYTVHPHHFVRNKKTHPHRELSSLYPRKISPTNQAQRISIPHFSLPKVLRRQGIPRCLGAGSQRHTDVVAEDVHLKRGRITRCQAVMVVG